MTDFTHFAVLCFAVLCFALLCSNPVGNRLAVRLGKAHECRPGRHRSTGRTCRRARRFRGSCDGGVEVGSFAEIGTVLVHDCGGRGRILARIDVGRDRRIRKWRERRMAEVWAVARDNACGWCGQCGWWNLSR